MDLLPFAAQVPCIITLWPQHDDTIDNILLPLT